jgi:hypothetical protein
MIKEVNVPVPTHPCQPAGWLVRDEDEKSLLKREGFLIGAHERNRTFTPLRTADFESAASTNSATWASQMLIGLLVKA